MKISLRQSKVDCNFFGGCCSLRSQQLRSFSLLFSSPLFSALLCSPLLSSLVFTSLLYSQHVDRDWRQRTHRTKFLPTHPLPPLRTLFPSLLSSSSSASPTPMANFGPLPCHPSSFSCIPRSCSDSRLWFVAAEEDISLCICGNFGEKK